jgi:peptidoglycan/LPS O-acetylase OafA/YrhL
MSPTAPKQETSEAPAAHRAKHYLALDGLRGVAAYCVMAMHVGPWFSSGGICAHAYLAVDFFFLLSGFVLAHAYDERLTERRLSTLRFMALRLARLYPMILLGVAIASALLLLRYATGHRDLPLSWVLAAIGSGVTLLPLLVAPGSVEIFPIDGPMWSLFFELVANAVYAAAARYLRTPVLIVVVMIAALALIACGLVNGNLDVGVQVASFGWGWCRVGFSFFAGVLLCRLRPQDRWRGPSLNPLLAAVVLVALFCVPRSVPWRAAYDLVCTLAVFPAVLVLCVNAKVQGRAAVVCRWSGELSYPVYVLQKPLGLCLISLYLAIHATAWPRPLPGVVAAVVIGVVSFAALKLWDEPVRKALSSALRARPSATPDAGPRAGVADRAA